MGRPPRPAVAEPADHSPIRRTALHDLIRICVRAPSPNGRPSPVAGVGALPRAAPSRSLAELLATALPFAGLWGLMRLSLGQGYGLRHVNRLTLLHSLKGMNLALWDEHDRRLVSFAQARRLTASRSERSGGQFVATTASTASP